jgi:D-3-phosphoglycerate dehydrogenase
MTEARVWLGPERPDLIQRAITAAGGREVRIEDANIIVWASDHRDVKEISSVLSPAVSWVQLDSAGIDDWLAAEVVDDRRTWTGAQGCYAGDVAEHVVAFILAASRRFPQSARSRRWGAPEGQRLKGTIVGIIGGGGIAKATVPLLRPFGVRTVVQSKSPGHFVGVEQWLPYSRRDELLAKSDFVVLATPLTADTRQMIGADQLALMQSSAWLINVARGALLDTTALVHALEAGQIAGACLDVTDPEPLPENHPLWGRDDVLITPHVANPWWQHFELYAERVKDNIQRFRAGQELVGVIDPANGY